MIFTDTEIVDILDHQHYTGQEGLATWRGVELAQLTRYFRKSADDVLAAMRKVADRYRLRAGETRCKSCGMPMRFRNGRIPYDRENLNHFISCPNRAAHRKG